MHAVSFLLKRAHLTTTDAGQKILYAVPGMTPARFDILCYLRQSSLRWGMPGGGATQRAVRHGLGLHASVISRMLTRLEQLGWIRRFPDPDDRRVKIVELTALGIRKTWEAMRKNFRGRALASQFETLARTIEPTRHVLESLDRLVDTIDVIAADFGDRAHFHYDYGSAQRPPFRFCKPATLSEMMVEIVRGIETERAPQAPTPYQRWIAPLLKPFEPEPKKPRMWTILNQAEEEDAADFDDDPDTLCWNDNLPWMPPQRGPTSTPS